MKKNGAESVQKLRSKFAYARESRGVHKSPKCSQIGEGRIPLSVHFYLCICKNIHVKYLLHLHSNRALQKHHFVMMPLKILRLHQRPTTLCFNCRFFTARVAKLSGIVRYQISMET